MKFFGWQPIEPSLMEKIKKVPKSVTIFPHTSYWDIITLSVYILNYKNFRNHFDVITRKSVDSFPANYIFSNFFRALPVQSPKEKRIEGPQGTINKTIELLKERDNYCVMMSPEGSLKKTEWKTGYLALALKLKVPILIMGFDFLEHKMKVPGYVVVIEKNNEKIKGKQEYELEIHDFDNDTVKRISLKDIPQENSTSWLATMRDQIQPHAEELMNRIWPLIPSRSRTYPKDETIKHSDLSALGKNNLLWVLILIIVVLLVIALILLIRKYQNKQKF